MKSSEVLDQVAQILIDHPEQWTQRTACRDADGKPCFDGEHVSACVGGHVEVLTTRSGYSRAVVYLDQASGMRGFVQVNDEQGLTATIAMTLAAAELARAAGD